MALRDDETPGKIEPSGAVIRRSSLAILAAPLERLREILDRSRGAARDDEPAPKEA